MSRDIEIKLSAEHVELIYRTMDLYCFDKLKYRVRSGHNPEGIILRSEIVQFIKYLQEQISYPQLKQEQPSTHQIHTALLMLSR